VVAALLETEDKNAYVYGDRVPYVVARGGPGQRLYNRALHIKEFLWEEGDG
jgi:hypothetical protein